MLADFNLDWLKLLEVGRIVMVVIIKYEHFEDCDDGYNDGGVPAS